MAAAAAMGGEQRGSREGERGRRRGPRSVGGYAGGVLRGAGDAQGTQSTWRTKSPELPTGQVTRLVAPVGIALNDPWQ